MTIIQHRRDAAADWTSNNPTLAEGEFGWESDTGALKIGDGSTAWTSLAYYIGKWTSFTPTWTNFTIGNGSQTHDYFLQPDGLRMRGAVTLGSTSSMGTAPYFDLPIGTYRSSSARSLGAAMYIDADAADHIGLCQNAGGANTVRFLGPGAAGVSATAPFTWATGDIFYYDLVVALS